MYLRALANHVPPDRFQQSEVWAALLQSHWARTLRPGAMELLDKVLNGQSGICTRHFCLPDLAELFTLDAETLNHRFEKHAPALGAQALRSALDQAHLLPQDLDALFVCTCTGYLCPALSSHISHRVGLRSDAFLLDNVGQGCGAAIPTLRAASQFLQAHPQAQVACLAVELCSAAFYLDNDPGVLISAALFADGASASIWSQTASSTQLYPHLPPLRCDSFQTLHRPEQRELLRFVNAGGKLRNVLDRSVPALAAETVQELYLQAGEPKSSRVLIHPGGKKVIEAVEKKLPSTAYDYSRNVLRDFGNMSSPSVLFALEAALKAGLTEAWLCSFGAGYTCHACSISSNSSANSAEPSLSPGRISS
jgi:predicted naringenin-chalcone synthase